MTAGNGELRPLVIGAGGLLGSHLARRLGRRWPFTVGATRAELDLLDRFRIAAELERLEPDVVICAAAWSDVDGCERDPQRALAVNRDGPATLARACRSLGARLIHISTDYVFDGLKDTDYEEDDPAEPVNHYGRSKLEGERAVLGEADDVVVLRVSFLFGPGRDTWLDRIAAAAGGVGGPVRAIDGWSVKPTYTVDAGEAIEWLLATDYRGLLHFAGGPGITRLAFAREVMAAAGGDPEAIVAVDPGGLSLPAERPARSVLSTRRYEELTGQRPRAWTEGLREYLAAGGRDPLEDDEE